MGNGLKKPKDNELDNDLKLIAEIPERVKELNVIRLKELLQYLERRKLSILDMVNWRLMAQEKDTFEYAAQNTYQGGFNYYSFIELEKIINNQLSKKENFDPVFKNPISQRFFEFLFLHFIVKEKYPKTNINYVFRQLADKSRTEDHINTDYEIVATQIEFAEFYNKFIVGNVPTSEINDFKISINLNEVKFKELYNIGSLDKRNKKLNSLILEFEKNNVTGG